ncbi:MAG: hypothetical protein ACPGSB_00180 [Opitutales bacterium]
MDFFSFQGDSPVHARVLVAPDPVLAELKRAEGHGNHKPYRPSPAELRLFKDYFDTLPPRCRAVMKERLLAIYFIDGLHVGGGTHWVLDDTGKIYAYMTLNRRIFDLSISDFLTLKEKTVYSREPSNYRVKIQVSGEYKSLLYILTHESLHLVDYVDRITPYAEQILNELQHTDVNETRFTEGIWWQFDQPLRKFRFRLLRKVKFYSENASGVIPMSDAKNMYRSLEDTPFVSLYSCVNWAEDFAEAITMRHLTKELGLTYSTSVTKDGNVIFQSRPVEKPLFEDRFLPLEQLYD